MDDDANARTRLAYEAHAGAYIARTTNEVSAEARAWLDRALQGLPRSARVLEIGSAFGRDAAYIQSKGFDVVCTDATEAFLRELSARGFAARRLDVLTDDIEGRYDLILANAVLLHFTRPQFDLVAVKLARALEAKGRLAISLKAGEGEGWSDAKLGVPRYFCYWQADEVSERLSGAEFASVEVTEAETERAHARWLYIIAGKA